MEINVYLLYIQKIIAMNKQVISWQREFKLLSAMILKVMKRGEKIK